MKRGKLSAFCIALRDAYKKVNEDRDLARECLKSVYGIVNRYNSLVALCDATSKSLQGIRDQLFGEPEIGQTMQVIVNILSSYLTITGVNDVATKEYHPIYNATKGKAFSGFGRLFEYIKSDMEYYQRRIEEKITERDYAGAIRQYIAMEKSCKWMCNEAGLLVPEFIEDFLLEKYK